MTKNILTTVTNVDYFGKGFVSAKTIEKIAQALNVDVAQLFLFEKIAI